MKQIITFLFAGLIFILSMSTPGFAEDNDIFGECSTTVEPNILVVIDSSGSMGTAVGSSTRIEIAREAVKSIIDDYADNNRFGIMRFHSYSGGWILAKCELKDTYILDINGDLKTGTALETALTAYKTYLKGIVSNVPANGHTPLAETLFEAGLYFAGEASEFNSGTYTSPQGYRCRKNYIILMTDGQPYSDYNELRGKSINGVALDNYVTNLYPKSGSSYYYTLDPELHNVAKLLFENDINDQLPASGVTTFVKQNVLTYPIGFGSSLGTKEKALLQDTADEGQGLGEGMGTLGDASTAANLEGVFHSIMAEIEEKKTTFASPIVPIAASSNAYAGNSVYLSMFKPDDDNSQWVGNLKKYRLNENNEFISCNSDEKILDAGVIKATARSCWSTANDGPYVAQGGAGAKLLANSSRNIIYNDASGTDGFLTFDSTNLSTLTPLVDYFPYVDDNTITMDDFVKKITMEGEDSETGWKLYDLNHSKPAIAAYANDKKYLFVGSNGGMLHCIDDFNGEEKWAFIPKEQFNRLDKVYASDDHYHFMDGSPTVVDIVDDGNNYSNLVIVGERRGGNHYYAIDISDISSPKYKYTFPDVDDPSFGQSWKQAEFVYYKEPNAGTPTQSFLLSGGYDDRYDHVDDLVSTVDGLNTDADPNNNVPDVKGAQIHIINASDGTTIQKFDKGFTGLEHMEASILSAWGIDLVDDSEKAISQIYASDLEGHIFALRDIDLTKSGDVIDGNWEANHLFEVTGASRGKKTFRELDFVQEFMYYYSTTDKEWKHTIGDFTYFGTGDRADPLNNNGSDKTNYFYCVKNDWVTKDITTEKTIDDYGTLDSEPTGANNDLIMVDVTDAIIYDGEIPESVAHISSRSNRGWYIKLEGLGEKCLSTPIVYAGVVYFTTYTPPSGSGNDPCGTSLIGGIAQLYALDYKTGGPVYDFGGDRIIDPGEKLTKTDRAYTLKTQNITIPPDFVIIITEDGAKGFVGPEDFPVREPNAGVTSFYWKTL